MALSQKPASNHPEAGWPLCYQEIAACLAESDHCPSWIPGETESEATPQSGYTCPCLVSLCALQPACARTLLAERPLTGLTKAWAVECGSARSRLVLHLIQTAKTVSQVIKKGNGGIHVFQTTAGRPGSSPLQFLPGLCRWRLQSLLVRRRQRR